MTPLERTRNIVADHMEQIESLFNPGAEITVCVRRPGKPEQDFLMTSETDLRETVALIERRIEANRENGNVG